MPNTSRQCCLKEGKGVYWISMKRPIANLHWSFNRVWNYRRHPPASSESYSSHSLIYCKPTGDRNLLGLRFLEEKKTKSSSGAVRLWTKKLEVSERWERAEHTFQLISYWFPFFFSNVPSLWRPLLCTVLSRKSFWPSSELRMSLERETRKKEGRICFLYFVQSPRKARPLKNLGNICAWMRQDLVRFKSASSPSRFIFYANLTAMLKAICWAINFIKPLLLFALELRVYDPISTKKV